MRYEVGFMTVIHSILSGEIITTENTTKNSKWW